MRARLRNAPDRVPNYPSSLRRQRGAGTYIAAIVAIIAAAFILSQIGAPPWLILVAIFTIAVVIRAAMRRGRGIDATQDAASRVTARPPPPISDVPTQPPITRSAEPPSSGGGPVPPSSSVSPAPPPSALPPAPQPPTSAASSSPQIPSANRAAPGAERMPPSSPLVAVRESAGPAVPEKVTQRSIAVLPFEATSADAGDDYVGEGIAELVLQALARMPSLRVSGRVSSFSFKGEGEDHTSHDIGQRLNVDNVLVGAVRQDGDRLRIEIRLIDSAGGRQLWSDQFDRELRDSGRLHVEIARAVATRLGVEPGRGITAVVEHPAVPDAYRLYLKGRHLLGRLQEPQFTQAIESFEAAIALVPDYALAHAALAECQIIRAVMLDEPYSASPSHARKAATRALELNDAIPEAHAVLGLILTYYDLDWEGAERAFRRALELGADSAWVHSWYGDLLAATRRFDLAVDEARRAQELEPLAPLFRWNIVQNLWLGARFDDAEQEAAAALELFPELYVAHVFQGLIAWSRGAADDAVETLDHAVQKAGGDPTFTAVLTAACYHFGVQPRGELLFATLQDRAGRGHISAAWLALIHLCRDDSAAAIRWLRAGRDKRDSFYALFRVCVEALHIPLEPEVNAELDRIGFP